MADSSVHFRPPGQLNINSGNVAENFRKWKQQLLNFMTCSGSDEKDNKVQTAMILNFAGEDVLEISNHFTFDSEESKTDPTVILKKIEEYCLPKKSEVYESYKFWTWPHSTPIDHFIADLRTQAKNCNFDAMTDRMIRDKVIFSLPDAALKTRLLREQEKMTLGKLIDACRAHELAQAQSKEMGASSSVNRMTTATHHKEPAYRKQQGSHDKPKEKQHQRMCLFCNKQHVLKKEQCPAYGKTCRVCKQKNHFSSSVRCGKAVRAVANCENETDSDDPSPSWIGCLRSNGDRVFATMLVNNNKVDFQIDTGAEVNIITRRYVASKAICATQHKLITWNQDKVTPLGETTLSIVNPVNNNVHSVNFIVVPNSLSCLLSLKTSEDMGLITVHTKNFEVASVSKLEKPTSESIIKKFPSVFSEGLGKLPGTVRLHLKENYEAKVLPCRRIPFAIQNEVKSELDRLVNLGVLAEVTEPTEWVNQMATVRKKNGSLRICIDPAHLNSALMREHYQLPVIEDVLDKFNDARVFSKLDVSTAYWHLELDNESSLLTTMITPFGRYKWRRLPFGLSVSSEIFQRNLSQALEGVQSAICIADDIALMGKNDEHHDDQLNQLLTRCQQKGIKLNSSPDKLQIRCSEMVLHGHVFTLKGVKPDPSKVEAILKMPTPEDVSAVRRFCGMVQYLARFMPHLAQVATPLRDLTHKGIPWSWTEEHDNAFKAIKDMACKAPLLGHYDPKALLTLQTDASSHGLGAALLQDNIPIAYASRALTATERRYAQIEKECLSVVFGLERFDQYTYGRPVMVENDHKPLESLLQKALRDIPKRLQAMRMRIARYDIMLKYKPGPTMVLPDTLSRAHDDESAKHGPFDDINSLVFMPISDKRMDEIRTATQADKTSQLLIDVIQNGWQDRENTDPELYPYFSVRDTLSLQDGIVLKGERLVIPRNMRPEIKKLLHASHLGTDSMLRRARDLIYWPGMNDEIKQLAQSCDICQRSSPRQQKEPLIPHVRGEIPYQKVGLDLFSINGRNYLISVDYLSSFFEIDYLQSTTASSIIMKLKSHIARYGIPQVIISDNAQFASREFDNFCKNYGVTHKTSSPGHSRANGKAEAAVKAAKTLLKKCHDDGSDPHLALLELRNTPIQGIGLSPAQMMLQRRTRTLIPISQDLLKPTVSYPQASIERRVKAQKRCYDKVAKSLPPVNNGENVLFDTFDPLAKRPKWRAGTVVDKVIDKPRSYIIQDQNGTPFRRNRVHIKPIPYTPLPEHEMMETETSNSQPVSHTTSPPPSPVTTASASDSTTPSTPPSTPQPTISLPQPSYQQRPRRNIRPPAYLKDYVSK